MLLNRSQEELFYHIRNEEVVLFVGAGFSAYAGYPLGADLGTRLHELLPETHQHLDHKRSLDQFTETIVRSCGSRDLLNRLLDQVFTALPKSTADHDMLAKVSHLNTIITTNYDTMFEDAYGDRANLIWLDEHVGFWDPKKVNIIKIHGHIADKDSIVLTQEDYSDFITKDFNTPLWTAVLNQIGTRHVLFLGYGYEDPNIWALVKKLNQSLGDSKKRMFLISPGNDPRKIRFLESKGIEFIQHSGTSFLGALIADIKDNLITDLESGRVCADTARSFSRMQNASLTIEDTDKGFRLKTISPVVEAAETWNAKFNYKAGGETMHRINSFQNTNELLEMQLNASEIENFKLIFEGLKLLDQDELGFLNIKKIPKQVSFDLTFLSEGWEVNGMQADIYSVKGASRIISKIYGLSIEANISFSDTVISSIRWDFKRPEKLGTLSDEIGLYSLLSNFFSQKQFTLFFSDGSTLSNKCHVFQEESVLECNKRLKYLGWLKVIERRFNTRFGLLEDIDEDNWKTAEKLVQVIEEQRIPIAGDYVLSFEYMDKDAITYFRKINDLQESPPLEFFLRQDEIFSLHGQTFICKGKKICIESPMVKNLNTMKAGVKNTLIFSSRSNKIWQQLTIDIDKKLIEEEAIDSLPE
jgi:hypothetical protein